MPAGTFYVFPDVSEICRRLRITSHGLAMYLLEGADEKIGVACLGGECFGPAGAGFLPEYDVAVFDEAHTLEAVAAEHLGLRVTGGQFEYLRVLQAQRAVAEANLELVRSLGETWQAGSEIAGLMLEDQLPLDCVSRDTERRKP